MDTAILSDNGIVLFINPNLKVREAIIKRLKINDGYCPCVSEKNKDTKCPCKEVRTEGICHCMLYVKKEEK